MALPSMSKMQLYIKECEHREIPNPKSSRGFCKLIGSYFGPEHRHGVEPRVCAVCFTKYGDKPDPDHIKNSVTRLMFSLIKGVEMGFYTSEETETIYIEVASFVTEIEYRVQILNSLIQAVELNKISSEKAEQIANTKLKDALDVVAKKPIS